MNICLNYIKNCSKKYLLKNFNFEIDYFLSTNLNAFIFLIR